MKKNHLKTFLSIGIIGMFLFSCSENELSQKTNNSTNKTIIAGDKIPDGTYAGNAIYATLEQTYLDNKLIKRVVNGKDEDPALAPKQVKFSDGKNKERALSFIGDLEENDCPCISASSQTSLFSGEVIWIVEYDYVLPCWYDQYNK